MASLRRRATVFARWRSYLTDQLKAGNPVFTPLAALHALPEAEFATKAADAVGGLPKAHPVIKAARDALQTAAAT